MYWQSFLVALSFFTRIPLPRKQMDKAYEGDISLSTLFYPAVGIVIASVLLAWHFFIGQILPDFLNASIILCLWVGLTGALHIDGFADCIDGFYASHKSPQRTLEVMADPQVGSMAVVYVCLLLILKCALLSALLMHTQSILWVIFFTPVLARFLVLPFMYSTPYVRQQGIASNLDIQRFSLQLWGMGTVLFTWMAFVFGFSKIVILFILLALFAYAWRRLWMKKIAGYSGDCAGALIEIAELLILFCLLWGTL